VGTEAQNEKPLKNQGFLRFFGGDGRHRKLRFKNALSRIGRIFPLKRLYPLI
jgi:hypothetical protein